MMNMEVCSICHLLVPQGDACTSDEDDCPMNNCPVAQDPDDDDHS
jgi:hypothetical protein